MTQYFRFFTTGLLFLPWILFAQNIYINEVMPSNNAILSDEYGDFPDWIELYNAESSSVNLEGYGISDDPLNLTKWIFPNINLTSGNHLLLFASGKDRADVIAHWETVIQKGDLWKYQIGNASIPSNWKELSYDDTGWSEGPSGFGYNDGDDATQVPAGTISIYIRHVFNIENPDDVLKILLHVDYDDAFVAYLNGEEIARSNIGISGTPVSYNDVADGDHGATVDEGGSPEMFDIASARSFLNKGDNVLCIQGYNKNSGSSDMSLIPFLSFGLAAIPQNGRGSDPILNLKSSMFHTNFKISNGGESLFLISPDGQLIDSLWIYNVPENISFGRKPDGGSEWFLFDAPTPGSANISEGYLTTSSKPDFSHTRGFYTTPFHLSLHSEDENTFIMYTLDGSQPDRDHGVLYSGSILISTTSTVRAMAYTENGAASAIRTHTFIFTEDVVKQDNSGLPAKEHNRDHVYWTEAFDLTDVSGYEGQIQEAFQDIPTMSIVASYETLFGINGILRGQNLLEGSGGKAGDPNESGWIELVGCSAEMIYPENEKYSRYKNWQQDSGIKIQGGGGRWDNGYYDHKQSFTLEFKKEYGEGLLKNDIFKTAPYNRSTSPEVFDKIILRAGHNKSWGADWDRENTVYTRDQFGRDLQLLMSGWGSHGTFVHLYINGKYWGLYNPCERMDDNTLAIYFGGDNENYYFGKGKGGDQFGSDDRFDYLNNTTWTNKQLSELQEYLAVDEYIDLCLLYCYSNPGDGPQYYYGNCNDPAGPVYFTAWDIEDSFDGGSRRTGPPVSVDNVSGGSKFEAYHRCKNNIDFKMKFADRAYKHCYNDRILTDEKAGAVWDSLNTSIEKAILCEIARWGDERGKLYDYQHWQGEWQDVNDDLYRRADRLISVLKSAGMYPRTIPPVLKNGEKTITESLLFTESDFMLTLQSSGSSGIIYYTTDGSDPRTWDLTGNVSPGAIEITDQNKTISISETTVIKCRMKNGSEWSALREIKIVPETQSGLIINEINYNSALNFDTEDWVEIYNNSDEDILLEGWYLTDSDSSNVFHFSDDLVIEKKTYLVICRDSSRFKTCFPDINNCIGNINFKLDNSGDEVKLYQNDVQIDHVKYENVSPWPTKSIGNGATLELLHPSLDNNKSENWTASRDYGTPGRANSFYLSDVGDLSAGTLLNDFMLFQNYPNPFNPYTHIHYSLHKPSYVNISVFDITGKKVAELMNMKQNAGHYHVTFEPKDLASGVYFYRLNVGQSSKIKRMLMLK